MSSPQPHHSALAELDHVFRHHYARLCAALTRAFGPGRLDLVEDVVQDALVKAMRAWPFSGVPDDPAGWLTRVAHNLAIDTIRKQTNVARKSDEIAAILTSRIEVAARRAPGEIADDTLRMVFTCCHPALPRDARVTLTLKTLCGFGVREIASALLTKEAAIAQRLTRAKAKLQRECVVFEVPSADQLTERLDSVLDVLYLLFNEGYRAHRGADLVRVDLIHESIRLAQSLLDVSLPDTALPAIHALLALMHLLGARVPARLGAGGEVLTLAQQDRRAWDTAWIQTGFAHLEQAAVGPTLTRYHVEASIAALHAMAREYTATDWPRILDSYDTLAKLLPTSVVRLNRAVAIAKARSVAEARLELDQLVNSTAMQAYPLFHATRAHLAWLAEDRVAARAAYDEALALPMTEPESGLLRARRTACAGGAAPPPF